MTSIERETLRRVMLNVQSPMIVELGAYRGEDGPFLRSLGNGTLGVHIMVEPDYRNIAYIVEHRPATRVIHGAIAMQTGMRNFNFSDDHNQEQGSGSILPPTGHLTHFPHIRFDKKEMVKAYSLDDLFAREGVFRCDLLYVDIQGAEKEMILGGQDALSRTLYLFMEAEKTEFYRGQAVRPDLLAMLPEWDLIGDFDFNILLRNRKVYG